MRGGPGAITRRGDAVHLHVPARGLFHLAGNMLYLWIFGNNVEDAMGRVRFMVFYLLCGMIAAVSHAATNTQSLIPMIGASGAVSGVLGAYLLLYPHARVLTLFTLGFFVRMIEVPAMVVLGFWLVFQFLSAMISQGSGGGVAWYAHIGGFSRGWSLSACSREVRSRSGIRGDTAVYDHYLHMRCEAQDRRR